jgi:hypothetical protein
VVAVLVQVAIQAEMLMLMVAILLFYLLHLQAVVELAVVKTLLKEILVNQVDQVALVREALGQDLALAVKVIMALQEAVFKVVAEVALAVVEVAA